MQEGVLNEIKGDKLPVGGYAHEDEQSFTKHVIDISKPTTFYVYSDGFQDQFGGPKGRKFMSRRLKNLLLEIHSLPMGEQKQILEEKLQDWMGEQRQVDDILVIGAHLS
jgi:serine phosphatase RsbU (regulator of sigma subunit)